MLHALFDVSDLLRLVFAFIPRMQQQSWFCAACKKNDTCLVGLMLRANVPIDTWVLLSLFDSDCVEQLNLLYDRQHITPLSFVTKTWQDLFVRASLRMCVFLFSFLPHTMLLHHMQTFEDRPDQFAVLYAMLQPADQFVVFVRACDRGCINLVSHCLCHQAKHDWRASVLVDFCNLHVLSTRILKILFARGVDGNTLQTMQQRFLKNIDHILMLDISVTQVLYNHSVILSSTFDACFKRAVQLRRIDHMEFFWKPGFNTNLYMPHIPPSLVATGNDNEIDDYDDSNRMTRWDEFCQQPVHISSFDRIFQSLSSRTRIPRDLPNAAPTHFSQQIASQIQSHCEHMNSEERAELFAKCCAYDMLALAQYLWHTSRERPQLASSFIDCKASTSNEFLEFAWTCSAQTFRQHASFMASHALRRSNFVLWNFLFEHDLLTPTLIFNPSHGLWVNLCQVASRFLALVWRDGEQAWQEGYQILVSCAIKTNGVSVLKFLSRSSVSIAQPFLLEHRSQLIYLNAVPLLRRIDARWTLNDATFYNYLLFAVNNDFTDLFHEILRFGTITYELLRTSDFHLFINACTTCLSAAQYFAQHFPQVLADAACFLKRTLPHVITLMEHVHWDVDFNTKLPPLFC